MQTRILKATDSRSESVLEAAKALREGQLVVFPTETVYGVGANATSIEAIAALGKLKDRGEKKPFTLHIAEPGDAARYVSKMTVWGERLVHRCWPGPVTIVFPAGREGDKPAIDANPSGQGGLVASAIYHEGRIGLRCPDDPVAHAILSAAGVPVVASSANLAGRPAPRSADEALAELRGAVPLVIDSGPTRYAKPSTVVLVSEKEVAVLREGVIPTRSIERMARTRILFICTGNLSRSPLAEALAEQVLAEKYGCRPGELDQWGVEVNSAGVAAMDGAPAATDARIAVHDYGADLQKHRSRMLRVDALLSSDYIFGMTRSHVMAAQAMAPEAAARVELLRPDGREVDDPVSGGAEAHRRCAKEIYEALRKQIAEKVI